MKFGGNLSSGEAVTTVHEIGHTLGLLHTHENTRGIGNFYGDASDCFQESVSRSKTQGVGCIATIGQKKCEINGDALCDTEAAPNTKNNTHITNDNDCNYIGGGTDNWGDAWNPPTRNYMSYTNKAFCRSEFTLSQIAVMYAYIMLNMQTNSSPWYNLHSISLSGSVNSGENELFIVPKKIEAASGNTTYTINSGAAVNLLAGESITLSSGFHAKAGSNFSAKISAISDCSNITPNTMQKSAIAPITNLNQKDIDECLSIIKKALNREYMNYEKENNNISLYPNPNNGSFTIQTNSLESIEKLEVVTMLGQVVYSVQHPSENTITLPTGIKGAFFVRITTQKESVTQKIIVE